MKAEEMWEKFKLENKINKDSYETWAFGGAPDELADLVVTRIKTATASAYPLYEQENETLPKVNDFSVILNSKDEALCIIRTTKVHVETFNNVSKEHAFKEGEGDRSLEYWREVHKKFFRECLEEYGLEFSENMKVVCEEFEVVY